MSHANARLTFHARVELVRRVRQAGRPAAHVAAEMGVSRQCAHRWLARFEAEGLAGLRDRSSRPRSFPSQTSVEVEAGVLACRDAQRIGRDRVAEVTGVPARTVSRILARHIRPPLAVLDPVTGMVIRASDSDGKLTIRYASRLHHIGIGARWAGTRVLILARDRNLRIITEHGGELIRELVLDASRDYQPQDPRV